MGIYSSIRTSSRHSETARLVEIIDELGLTAPEAKERRYPITPDDVHLIAWMAIIPPS